MTATNLMSLEKASQISTLSLCRSDLRCGAKLRTFCLRVLDLALVEELVPDFLQTLGTVDFSVELLRECCKVFGSGKLNCLSGKLFISSLCCDERANDLGEPVCPQASPLCERFHCSHTATVLISCDRSSIIVQRCRGGRSRQKERCNQ